MPFRMVCHFSYWISDSDLSKVVSSEWNQINSGRERGGGWRGEGKRKGGREGGRERGRRSERWSRRG